MATEDLEDVTEATKPETPRQSPEWVRGAFDALEAVRESVADFLMSNREQDALAERLGVPVLFIEAAMSYDRADVDELAAWWPAVKEA